MLSLVLFHCYSVEYVSVGLICLISKCEPVNQKFLIFRKYLGLCTSIANCFIYSFYITLFIRLVIKSFSSATSPLSISFIS